MSFTITASTITDPQLEALLAELGRLRTAVDLHAPAPQRAGGQATCQACRAETWPCPTVRAASPAPEVIAPQSPGPKEAALAEVIASQSLQEAP